MRLKGKHIFHHAIEAPLNINSHEVNHGIILLEYDPGKKNETQENGCMWDDFSEEK